ANMDDVMIEKKYEGRIEIIPVKSLGDVLEHALIGKGKESLIEKMQRISDIMPKGIIKNPTAH
ncbi:MAG: hypothetical protein H5T39_05095, partial [Methanobacteriales archaeon]|nr:hypothetical protein [Methanobacteriales archaeon]